jgi:hypothetical protein
MGLVLKVMGKTITEKKEESRRGIRGFQEDLPPFQLKEV